MTTKKPPIQWTRTQIEVAQLLQKGYRNADVAKTLSVAPSLVSKVKKALEKGFLPPALTHQDTKTAVQYRPASVPTSTEDGQAEYAGAEGRVAVRPEQMSPDLSLQLSELTTLLKLVPVVQTVPLTPVMLNMRELCVVELGWDENMPWEDMIDTIFFHLAKSWGYVLQDWYRDDRE